QEAKSLFASFGVNLAFGLAGAAAFEFVLSPLFKAIARKFTKGAADETLTLLPKIADNEVEVKPTQEIKFKTFGGGKPKSNPHSYAIDDPEAPWIYHEGAEVPKDITGQYYQHVELSVLDENTKKIVNRIKVLGQYKGPDFEVKIPPLATVPEEYWHTTKATLTQITHSEGNIIWVDKSKLKLPGGNPKRPIDDPGGPSNPKNPKTDHYTLSDENYQQIKDSPGFNEI